MGTAGEAIPPGEDPTERRGQMLLPLGKPTTDPRWITTYPCLKQFIAHGQRHKDQEIGGVLLGEIWRCPSGRITEMREALPAVRTEASLGHVTFSHETWGDIYNYLEHTAPGLKMVGWYHTHPGFGVFFSEQDRFIQRHFFAGTGQLGLVADPQQEAIAAYTCEEGEVLGLPGIWIAAKTEAVEAARGLLHRFDFSVGEGKKKGFLQRFTE